MSERTYKTALRGLLAAAYAGMIVGSVVAAWCSVTGQSSDASWISSWVAVDAVGAVVTRAALAVRA